MGRPIPLHSTGDTGENAHALSNPSGDGGASELQFTGDGAYTASTATMDVDIIRQNPVVYHFNIHKQSSRESTVERKRGMYSYSTRDIGDESRR
jgi:hypothetical protein